MVLDAGCWVMGDVRWKMGERCWKMGAGRWMLNTGRWKMEDGRWKMEVGCERQEAISHKLKARCLMLSNLRSFKIFRLGFRYQGDEQMGFIL